MNGIKKFFSGLLVVLLIGIILGGVGFVGYNIYNSGGLGMNMETDTTDNTTDTTDTDNMSGMSNNTSTKNEQNNISLNQINSIMKNKDTLDQSALILESSIKLMTLDPYGVKQKTESKAEVVTDDKNVKDSTETTTSDTTVNVYSSTDSSSSTNTLANAMENMGTTYDQGKMEQVHAGLYKLSVGMQLMDQLKNNLSYQTEQAGIGVANPSEYYINQYYITADNRVKLNSILTYLDDAANLVNINPYVSDSGAVYDKDRMLLVHESITKRAEAIVGLNKLDDDFSKQLISLTSLAQNTTSVNEMDMSSGTGLFDNLNISTITSIVLVISLILFIIGLLGFIKSLFKPTKVQQ